MIRTASRYYVAAYAGLPRDVWLLALVMFVNRSGAMVLPFLTLYLTSQFALADAAAGQLISVYGIGAIAGSYLGGRLVERFGAFRVQTLCMFFSVPLYLVIPVCQSLGQLTLALLVLALVSEAVRPANATAIARITDSVNRTRAFALQRLAANLGFSFGPALGGFLASINFVLLFIVDGLTMLLAALTLLYFFRMRRRENLAIETPTAIATGSPLADGRFLLFLGLMLATMVVFMQFLVTYPLYLRDHFQLSKTQIGLMYAVNTSIIVLFEMVLVDFARRWSLLRILGWGSFLCCLGFGMLPFGTSGWYCVLAMVVATVGEMLSFPAAMAYVASRSPRGSEGRYMGWYTSMHSLVWVIAPTLGATVYEFNREALWLGGIVVGLLVLAGFRLLEQQTQPRSFHEVSETLVDFVGTETQLK